MQMPEASIDTKLVRSILYLIRIKDEIKFLYKRKAKLNVDL